MIFSPTPDGGRVYAPHDWLTRTAFVGRGKRVPSLDHTVFDCFAVL